MTDEPALLAAIAARPDDDTPRLVYADWLDDHGDAARAEFIRLQCALARGGPDNFPEAERADELENAHRTRWLTGVPTGPGLRWSFHRGFPERIEGGTQAVAERYDRVAAVPWLRDLCLHQFYWTAASHFLVRTWNPNWSELEVVGTTDPSSGFSGPAARRVLNLARSGQTAQLRALRLTDFELQDFEVAALAESPHLAGVHLLAVPGDPDRPLYAPLRARFGERLVGEGA